MKTRPWTFTTAYAKTTACTLFGGLAEGNVVLDGTSAGVDDIDQIGASSSVTVQNGGRFVIAAQADMTASNAFAIDAQSKVTVGGSAKVDLSKATFTGGGELPWLRQMHRAVAGRCLVTCHPNAGLPNALGEYDLTPEEMAMSIRSMMEEDLVNMVGGCCGTTPDFIRVFRQVIDKNAR